MFTNYLCKQLDSTKWIHLFAGSADQFRPWFRLGSPVLFTLYTDNAVLTIVMASISIGDKNPDVFNLSKPAHIEPPARNCWNVEKLNQILYITANAPQGLQQVLKAAVPCSVPVLSSIRLFSCFCFHLLVCRESQPLRGLKENTNRKFFSLCPLEGSRSSMRSRGWVGGVVGSRGQWELCPVTIHDPLKQVSEPWIQILRCSTWFLFVLSTKTKFGVFITLEMYCS